MFRIRLKELREKAGYSQYAFAAKFGVAQSTVGNWESGAREPNLDTIKRVADFFQVSIDYLLGNDPADKNKSTAQNKQCDLTYDEKTYNILIKVKELTPENRDKLLEMAKFFKEQQNKKKD